ncbi:HIT family protein [candidate division WWE3 bacterium CG22_combo_CG10-13_8_21_14_all_39_12]|uniref:HIT family protein n=2 Tax=Katanobacteria TaxID=422282 RepID=A0A2M7X4E2_UNCKA|nr:MAG: HIT family protein [candidate division WWE3 bacterium CG22_combo_CG10-13_8_21_14_all_39_12]PJA41045.1 MAG: HIT family protein [candidate division WWE3 bacterium CG_4_9_14_3_um_filter_39_7]
MVRVSNPHSSVDQLSSYATKQRREESPPNILLCVTLFSMDPNCIFCKIVAGEIPAHIVYEDEHTLAFLDNEPIREGHTLIVPKTHVDYAHHLNDEMYMHLMTTTKKIMLTVEKALSPSRVGVIIEGFGVNHTHVKVFPLNSPDDLSTHHEKISSDEEFVEMATLLSQSINN